jgi:hypothetical protein
VDQERRIPAKAAIVALEPGSPADKALPAHGAGRTKYGPFGGCVGRASACSIQLTSLADVARHTSRCPKYHTKGWQKRL